MKNIITYLDAHKLLSNVPSDNSFRTSEGVIVKNLHELESTLNHMTDLVFEHHVNDEKNDFKSWIYDVVQDEQLAESLSKAKTKKNLLTIIVR